MVLQAKSAVNFLIFCCIVSVSCSSSNKKTSFISIDSKLIPAVRTVGGSSLISDSGRTRYRVYAEVSEIYSNAAEPYQFFPEGVLVEQLDSLFQVEGKIVADTAYHYENKQLWHAIGNVVVRNSEGTTFKTSELFWDEKVPADDSNAFYTHKYVIITFSDGSFQEGKSGFRGNQSLQPFYLFSVGGEFLVDESAVPQEQEIINPDSIMLNE